MINDQAQMIFMPDHCHCFGARGHEAPQLLSPDCDIWSNKHGEIKTGAPESAPDPAQCPRCPWLNCAIPASHSAAICLIIVKYKAPDSRHWDTQPLQKLDSNISSGNPGSSPL